MCGIAGILGNNNSTLVKKMIAGIKHRGPDYTTTFQNTLGQFAFTRLSIIDLSDQSNQPFFSENKKISVIYNGEIYNFKELKKKYFLNINFKSNGDGEVILYLYQKFGISFIEKIKGMFAICIIDETKKKIFLIRDRFGIKPLYYHFNNKINSKILIFGSEIKTVLESGLVRKEMNINECFNYFKFSAINATDETFFKNIYQVPPAHFIEYDLNDIKIKKYYKIEEKIDEDLDKVYKFKSCINELNLKLNNSFLEHNQFDVECGVHLSGGVDSAVLVGLSKKHNKKYKSFTFDFEEKIYSELETAKIISDQANLENFSTIIPKNNLQDIFIDTVNKEFEPFSSLRLCSQYNLYNQFKNDAKVILCGDGGDEVGAGYSYYLIPWFLDMIREKYSAKKISKKVENSINAISNNTITDLNFILGSLGLTFSPGTSTIDGSPFFNESIYEKSFIKSDFDINYKIKKPFKSYLRNAQYSDIYHMKLPRGLRCQDRASMYSSVENRVPFLDHELVETSLQIPSRYKFLNKQQRIILKYPFKNLIKKEILFRNKNTIADPQYKFIKDNLKSYTSDLFHSSSFNSHGIFNKKRLIKLFDDFYKSKNHVNSFGFFKVICFETWFKEIMLS